MSLANTKSDYGWVAIALHWAAAVGVVAMFVTGLAADGAPTREARAPLMAQHIALGASLFLIFAARIASHYLQPKPAPEPQSKWLARVSSTTHELLIVAILIQIVSGPLAVWSGGRAIDVFGLVSLPSPMARIEWLHEGAEVAHAIGRFSLFALIPLHVLGALKHAIIDRDRTLQRMLWVRKGG